MRFLVKILLICFIIYCLYQLNVLSFLKYLSFPINKNNNPNTKIVDTIAIENDCVVSQCTAYTIKKVRCKNETTICNGRCWIHQ
jgi:hypothetical protein